MALPVAASGGRVEAAVFAALIVLGLLLDQSVTWGQIAVDAVIWVVFAERLVRADRDERVVLVACLVWATLGECFLSLVWGLYDYRLGNLPLFVPPGHVLLLRLGMHVALRVPERLAWAVPLVAAPLVVWQCVAGIDVLGVTLFAVLLLAMWRGRARRLYAVMFLLAWLMELWGTWLGNWTWRGSVPWLGWPMQNPPLAAGAFYCLLDALVMTTAHLVRRRPGYGAPLP